jgi:YbbR domain-containing protein
MRKLLNKKVIVAAIAFVFAIIGTFIAVPATVETTVTTIAVEKLVPADAE